MYVQYVIVTVQYVGAAADRQVDENMGRSMPTKKPAAQPRPPVRGRKEARLNLRLSVELKEEFEQAARVERKTLSSFVLEKVHLASQEVLSEQTEFALPDPEWTSFCAAISGEPQENRALQSLLRRRTPLSE